MTRANTITRRETGVSKLDKILGGGCVDKASVLLAGEHGAGKSTLLMQACIGFVGPERMHPAYKRKPETLRALYISSEQTFKEVGVWAKRLPGLEEKSDFIEFVSTRSVPEAMGAILEVKPHLVVVDSIRNIGDPLLPGVRGGDVQRMNVVRSIMDAIREVGFGTAFFVDYTNRSGDISGRKKLEHMVDTVLRLRFAHSNKRTVGMNGDRILEPLKNRYGSHLDSEVLTMTKQGLT